MTPIPDLLAVWSFYGFFIAFFIVEWVLTRSTLGARGKGDRDPATIFLFVVPFVGISLWLWIGNGTRGFHPTWLTWGLGLAAALAGFAIRVAAKRTLGKFFTIRVQIQEEHRVVRDGLYRTLRHPLYAGFILEWCAPPLFLGSPLGFLLVTLPQVIFILLRIPREEALLLETFGDEYRSYMGETKRLIPGVW